MGFRFPSICFSPTVLSVLCAKFELISKKIEYRIGERFESQPCLRRIWAANKGTLAHSTSIRMPWRQADSVYSWSSEYRRQGIRILVECASLMKACRAASRDPQQTKRLDVLKIRTVGVFILLLLA